jgi:DNA-directed RNA polymerase specialized sigma24 family protein
MSRPFDNEAITALVLHYQESSTSAREYLFTEIAESVLPLLKSTVFRYHWHVTLDEAADELVNRVILKLPKALLGFKSDRGTTFYNYFMNVTMNTFRALYARRERRGRYAGEFPEDEIADTNTERLTGDLTTLAARGREFESLIFRIPGDLAALVDPEYSGLVHYIAQRYLQRADNSEALYFTELRREVAILPNAKSLTKPEIDALVRMVIAGVRARLYPLHTGGENNAGGSGGSNEGIFSFVPDPASKGFLSSSSPRLWPLLLILNPTETRMLLYCLAGVHESVPVKSKWGRAVAGSEVSGSESVSAGV